MTICSSVISIQMSEWTRLSHGEALSIVPGRYKWPSGGPQEMPVEWVSEWVNKWINHGLPNMLSLGREAKLTKPLVFMGNYISIKKWLGDPWWDHLKIMLGLAHHCSKKIKLAFNMFKWGDLNENMLISCYLWEEQKLRPPLAHSPTWPPLAKVEQQLPP